MPGSFHAERGPVTRRCDTACVDVLTFEDAMRLLIDDAPSNFVRFRMRNRDPESPVMTEFDCPFTVEGAYDTCIQLLDYDVPRAFIRIYRGGDEAAADIALDIYRTRLQQFSSDPGEFSESVHHYDSAKNTVYWKTVAFRSPRGVTLSAACYSVQNDGSDSKDHSVWVEVTGYDVECIEGRPEDSPWHIIFEGTPLHASNRTPPDTVVRKKRQSGKAKHRRDEDGNRT
jgi:hypothetical protein